MKIHYLATDFSCHVCVVVEYVDNKQGKLERDYWNG